MNDLDDLRRRAAQQPHTERRVVFEVTWEPWPGYDPARVDPLVRARITRNLDRLTEELQRAAADVHVSVSADAGGLASARRPVTPLPYADLCERDAAASRAAWGDLEPDPPSPVSPNPSTGEQQ